MLLLLVMNFIWVQYRLVHFHLEILKRINIILLVEGDMIRTRSELEKLDENKVRFARIRDKNANFIQCQF